MDSDKTQNQEELLELKRDTLSCTLTKTPVVGLKNLIFHQEALTTVLCRKIH